MQQRARNPRPRPTRHQCEGGYLLLAILLMMAFMVVTLTYVVGPKLVQQIKRDREEEMIHRGTEYARAIKKFYKKNGRYPASLDDLDKGQIRFLRKRFKDPLAKDGKWKLLHYGDIQSVLNAGAPGTPAGALGQQGGAFAPGGTLGQPTGSGFGGSFGFGNSATPGGGQIQSTGSPFAGGNQPFGGQNNQPFGGQNPGSVSGVATGSDQGGNPSGTGGGAQQAGTGSDQQGGSGSNQSGGAFGGSTFGQNSSGNNQVFGGGAIVGVASVSKDPTIRIYNKKKTYDEWQFIYNPVMDQQNVLLRGPYQPTTIGNTNIGTPAGQLNGQQQGAFGQQNNGFGQQNNGFGQQNNGFGQSQQPGTTPSPTSSPQY